MKTKMCFLFSVLGACSCTLPPLHFYRVTTGYFLTEKTAAPFLDKKIELFVTEDPTTLEPQPTPEKTEEKPNG